MLVARHSRVMRISEPLNMAIDNFHKKLNTELNLNTTKLEAGNVLGKILLDRKIIDDMSFEITHYPRTSRKELDIKVKP